MREDVNNTFDAIKKNSKHLLKLKLFCNQLAHFKPNRSNILILNCLTLVLAYHSTSLSPNLPLLSPLSISPPLSLSPSLFPSPSLPLCLIPPNWLVKNSSWDHLHTSAEKKKTINHFRHLSIFENLSFFL